MQNVIQKMDNYKNKIQNINVKLDHGDLKSY